MKSLGSVVPALLLFVGCSNGGPPPSVSTSSLPAGAAARVANELVSAATVARIAERQGLPPRAAVELAISDALFAVEARASLPVGSARSIERAAAARSLLEQLGRDTEQAGPPTPAELAELVRERWLDFDRPPAARTTHAVVRNEQPERDARARAVAENLEHAVRGARSGDELMRLAKAVPSDGFEIRAENVPFVTADGRDFQPQGGGFKAGRGGFDLDYSRAANGLANPGDQTGLVKSQFGYHVIRLEERLPALVVPPGEVSERLGADALLRRAVRARRELLDKLRQASPVQLERAVNELTAQVRVP